MQHTTKELLIKIEDSRSMSEKPQEFLKSVNVVKSKTRKTQLQRLQETLEVSNVPKKELEVSNLPKEEDCKDTIETSCSLKTEISPTGYYGTVRQVLVLSINLTLI